MTGTELEFWESVFNTSLGIIMYADRNSTDFSPKNVMGASAKAADLAIIERRKREKNGVQISNSGTD